MQCIFCKKEHRRWRGGMESGAICPRCWARLLLAERREKYERRREHGRD